jgi:hypothetical protein
MSILFIWVEVFQISNKKVLFKKHKSQNILFLFFFFSKFLYLIWILIGVYLGIKVIIILFSMGIFKYVPLFIKNDTFINLYEVVSTFISIALLLTIFIQVFFLLL